MRSIELLAPARNLECGLEAIRHGADAVYIGAPRFGARAAAGNSIGDIAQLVDYAHLFGARIYVTVNTYNKPKVTVPDVTQTSERSARATLEALGLKVIRTELQPNEYRDLVLDVKTLDGERLTPGSQMEVGSGVVLVVSTADDPNEEVIVTDDEVTVKPQPTLQPHNHDIEEFF